MATEAISERQLPGFHAVAYRKGKLLKRWRKEAIAITPLAQGGAKISQLKSPEAYGYVEPNCENVTTLSSDPMSSNFFVFKVTTGEGENRKTQKFRATDAAQMRAFFTAMGYDRRGAFTQNVEVCFVWYDSSFTATCVCMCAYVRTCVRVRVCVFVSVSVC